MFTIEGEEFLTRINLMLRKLLLFFNGTVSFPKSSYNL